jgi:hypothetical protein
MRISFQVTARCFFLASLAFCCSSYRYFPKSRILATGGVAFGAISTRSQPSLWAS